MSSFGLSLGRKKKASSKSSLLAKVAVKRPKTPPDLLGFDLLFHLSYLSSISTGGIPRSQIFQKGGELPTSVAGYFDEINRLAETMNYQYAEACRIVGERATVPEIKSLLLRMSSSLATGEQERDFMANEAAIQAESYGNEYERKLESLRQWTDAYTAIIVSSVLIIVIAAISTVIYDLGTNFVLGLVTVMVMFSGVGVWVIYRSAPRELKVLSGDMGQLSQKVPRTVFTMLFPMAMAVGAMLFVAGFGFGWVLIASGLFLFPIGIVASRYDALIGKNDEHIGTFLRVVGTTATSIGTTPSEALGRIDMRSMESLTNPVRRLHILFQSRARPELAWRRFVEGTGSELVGRSVRVFSDGVGLGGDAEEVGKRASLMASKVGYLRAKRRMISQTFGWLAVAMHAVVVFLLVFVIEIVNSFGKLVQSAGAIAADPNSPVAAGDVFGFSFANMAFLQGLMVPVILVLSVMNALAAYVSDGGYTHRLFLYLSLTLASAGVAALVAPYLSGLIFSA